MFNETLFYDRLCKGPLLRDNGGLNTGKFTGVQAVDKKALIAGYALIFQEDLIAAGWPL